METILLRYIVISEVTHTDNSISIFISIKPRWDRCAMNKETRHGRGYDTQARHLVTYNLSQLCCQFVNVTSVTRNDI